MDEIQSLSIRGTARVIQTLERERENAFLFRDLTRLVEDVPIPNEVDVDSMLARSLPQWALVDELVNELKLGNGLVGRLESACRSI